MIVKIINILAPVILILLSIKYFIEIINEKITGNYKVILIKAFMPPIILGFIFDIANEIIEEYIDLLVKYSTLLYYIFAHIIIFIAIYTISIGIISFIIFLYSFIKDFFVIFFIFNYFPELLIKITRHFFSFINRELNPFYTIDFKSINVIRFIKKIYIISYLIAGVLILSYFNNYLELSIANDESMTLRYFSKDYEIYKGIFVMSLIPFSINYLMNKDKKVINK